ncbi:polar tube protein 1 [Encephalitozoon hellem ATCC 50504]|uniref:polar tube protein 1 n=1 Tax=Encephalitozoon hellem (strain ATCC 50504) TaxID=907965 RepID=UPI00026D3643|nr:polar tube protein 1 [Encephalitozoon hellem ATCC 50504]AFM98391.1 polar tube protein 1 [Encephalitozoon hellem ATCC 50504]|eukprot:XP_003887372.1 polar tube protein 1 [Encephalitozoon hellem ATCC 50504]
MKGISKILSASIMVMKLGNVYSAVPLCSNTYDPSQQQPSYVLIPSTPEAITNCAYSPKNAYVPSSPTTSSSTPGTNNDNETSPTTEDVGTCKISVVKHCDTPGASSTPCEPEQTIPAQPVTMATVTPAIIASVQTPSVVSVIPVTQKVIQPATMIVPPSSIIPGYYPNGTPAAPGQQGQILSGSVLAPGASSCQLVPGNTPGQMLPGMTPGVSPCLPTQGGDGSNQTIPGIVYPCQPGQGGSGSNQTIPGVISPCQPGQGGSGSNQTIPGIVYPCQPGQNGDGSNQTIPGVISPCQPGQGGNGNGTTGQPGQCVSVPQTPNPIAMPPISGISGNGYPTSTTYTQSLGQLGPCIDVQKPTSSCESQTNEKSTMQYAMEACAAPTPTVVIGNSEYLVGPGMYSSLTSPCNSCCQC